MRHIVETIIARAIMGIYRLLGIRRGTDFGELTGSWLGRIVQERHVVLDNLALTMPHLSDDERHALAEKAWRQAGRFIGEFAQMDRIIADPERLHLQGEQHVEAAKANGKTIIFVSCHYGNWEMLMVGIARLAGRAASLYRTASNPYMEKWIVKMRGPHMPIQIPKGRQGAKTMLSLIKQGTTPLCLLIDQRMTEGDKVRFLGQETTAPSAAVRLARQYGLPIILTHIKRRPNEKDGAHFTQIFDEALYIPKTDNAEADIEAGMQAIFDQFDKWIYDDPAPWFWMHDRFEK